MADYPQVEIRIDETISPTKLQQKLLALIEDDDVQIGVARIVGERANKYVPRKSGALRSSMKIVDSNTISWGEGLEYGQYQYNGEVYGPNFPIVQGGQLAGFFKANGRTYPILRGGTITGWFSIPGMQKQPKGRELGTPGEWRGWTFGYSTPNTKHHWIDEMLRTERRAMQNQITRYLKLEARKRDL